MKTSLQLLVAAALWATGCQQLSPHEGITMKSLRVHRATTPITIDGKLDEPAWRNAPSIPLALPKPEQDRGRTLEEAGTARLLYDNETLYVAFEFEDSDLVAEHQKDELHLLRLGDVAEVFLKPDDQLWYWEFHINPVGKTLTYGYPGRGRLGLPSTIGIPSFITAAAVFSGTINNYRDRDQGWNAEMAIPMRKLDQFGSTRNLKQGWTILLARYNYSAYRKQAPGPELSSAPVVSEINFHRSEDYAPLEFVP